MSDENSTGPMIGTDQSAIVAPAETLPTQIIDGDGDACQVDANGDYVLSYQGTGAYEDMQSQPFFSKGES